MARVSAFVRGGQLPVEAIAVQADLDGLPPAWRARGPELPRPADVKGTPGVVFWQVSGPDLLRIAIAPRAPGEPPVTTIEDSASPPPHTD